jgi:signal peptidase I
MRKALLRLAEPLAVLGIVAVLVWAAHAIVTPVRVGGWSMSPTLAPGDIVLVRLGRRPILGDIVLVRAQGHAPMLHRVVELLDGGAIRTRGDANEIDDLEPAHAEEVAGSSIAVVPLGAVLARWRGQAPYATMASQPNSTKAMTETALRTTPAGQGGTPRLEGSSPGGAAVHSISSDLNGAHQAR